MSTYIGGPGWPLYRYAEMHLRVDTRENLTSYLHEHETNHSSLKSRNPIKFR